MTACAVCKRSTAYSTGPWNQKLERDLRVQKCAETDREDQDYLILPTLERLSHTYVAAAYCLELKSGVKPERSRSLGDVSYGWLHVYRSWAGYMQDPLVTPRSPGAISCTLHLRTRTEAQAPW